jgi:lipopolysaccharide transport system permease protein
MSDVLWKYSALCRELVRRDLRGQFAGKALSLFWVTGHTALMLLVYVFVSVTVKKIEIDAGPNLPRDYTSYLFSGLVLWLAIAQALGRSPSIPINKANFVKQTVFPVGVLPLGATLLFSVGFQAFRSLKPDVGNVL